MKIGLIDVDGKNNYLKKQNKNNMKKIKIAFKKIVSRYTSFNTKLNVINWMLKTGQPFQKQRSWDRHGVDQLIFNYSANNYRSHTRFPLNENLRNFVDCLLFRGIIEEFDEIIDKWRAQERIDTNSYRMLSFPEESPPDHRWNLYWSIIELNDYINKPLKGELYSSDIKERVNPKIIDMSFSTAGDGYRVEYTYSFEGYNYEPGWRESFWQQEGESIDMFVHRVHQGFSKIINKNENK